MEDTHNFFIRPKGSETPVLVSNCHQLTPQAAQILLKPLEDPPPNTLWIIATTNPEKLPTAIRGRCRYIPIKRVSREDMTARLERVCKREEFDTSKVKEWDKILKTVCDLSNGQMRDALELLDAVMGCVLSGEKNPEKIISSCISGSGADVDQEAAKFCAALLTGKEGFKEALTSIKSVGTRQLILKSRWVLQYLIDQATVGAKFTPYGAKLFAAIAKKNGLKVKLARAIQIQNLLMEVELRLNTLSIDEIVIGQSMVGTFLLESE